LVKPFGDLSVRSPKASSSCARRQPRTARRSRPFATGCSRKPQAPAADRLARPR
jgi:hypothetical protein